MVLFLVVVFGFLCTTSFGGFCCATCFGFSVWFGLRIGCGGCDNQQRVQFMKNGLFSFFDDVLESCVADWVVAQYFAVLDNAEGSERAGRLLS